ncbi:hypothetical protein MKW98_021479 [Papaver atlanticum]|uniref:Aminotransferase-like plant mobile domain-containing protein n=1 Tax=Papaver atlanticum TaxID=357466 RepID=A0AAD4SSI7_9MAGN|nr:hypothetical protein MKW98_021479 [Papaver atlanticum]
MLKTKSKNDKRTFRSSLEQLVEISENIRGMIKDKPKHLEAIKRSPFWKFYRPFHQGRLNRAGMRKKQMGLEHILNTFDQEKGVFRFGGDKEFKSTAEQLAVLFGLQRRMKSVKEEEEDFIAQIVFCKTYLKGEKVMKRKDIIDALYAAAEDVTKPHDFVKLLVLYLCVAIFFPDQSGGKLPSIYLKYVFVMDKVSWPDLIHSYLMEALMDTKKPYRTLRGCTVYILYWFAEITHLISKYEGDQGKSKPRFVRWNTRVLAEKIGDGGMTTLKQDLTGSFIDPVDEAEQSLMTRIEIRQADSDIIVEKMVRERDTDGDSELSPERNSKVLVAYALNNFVVHQSKKRKMIIKEPRPCDGKRICNYEPERVPSSAPMTIPSTPILMTRESAAKENESDVLHTSVKILDINAVHIGILSSCSEVHTTGVESLEGDKLEEHVDATMIASSSKFQALDSTLPILTSVDVSPSFAGSTNASVQERVEGFELMDINNIPEENGNDTLHTSANVKDIHMRNTSSCSEEESRGIEPLEVVDLVEEPVDAARDASSSSNCLITVSSSVELIPSLTESTSGSIADRVEGFEFEGNLKIPEDYANLYKKICDEYGHMATKKVISNEAMFLACVTSLLEIISAMETMPGAELSVGLLERWERLITDAETLKFNIEWLREGFNRLKNRWNDKKVLDGMQVKYAGLCTRKEKLNTELSEVEILIRKAEAMISSRGEAIQAKLTQKNKFECEPVLGMVLGLG